MNPLGPLLRSAEFRDADEMAQAQSDAQVEYLALARGPFRGQRTHLNLGILHVQSGHYPPTISRGSMRAGWLAVAACSGSQDVRVNGHVIEARRPFLLHPGREFCVAGCESAGLGTLVLQAAAFPDLLDIGADRGSAPSSPRLHDPSAAGDDGPRIGAIAAALCAAAAADPAGFADHALQRAVIEDVRAALGAPLRTPEASSRQAGTNARRMSLVSKAAAFMRETPDVPIYTDVLTKTLGVSSRSLHESFTSVLGISPHSYLRLWRLSRARSALGAAKGSSAPTLVKQIALQYGFWHLGRFAADYRTQFGELPSATLARRDLPEHWSRLARGRANRGATARRAPAAGCLPARPQPSDIPATALNSDIDPLSPNRAGQAG
jgi:AraC family ethanolamine operon transcriptional activator